VSQYTAASESIEVSDGTPDRRMVRAELLGQHTHTTVFHIHVHIYRRDGKYIARGRYHGAAFGDTLGGDPLQAASRLRRLLTEVEEGTFLRPSEARRRPLKRGPIPRLDLRQLCAEYLVEVRRLRGKRTAETYLSRLAPALRFADTQVARRRWPLSMDMDREFAIALRAALFDTPVTRNGRAGGLPRPMSARQVQNVLTTLRGALAWASRPDVRKLPAEFVNPLGPDIVGHRPAKDPLRAVKLPLELRIRLVESMDAWQLCHLAPSLVLPMRPDEATGLLIADVDFGRRRLRFGTRFGGRDFNKGRQSFEVPFPAELGPVLLACVGGRVAGPLLRGRAVSHGLESPELNVAEAGEVEAVYEATMVAAARGTVLTEQDAKAVFRGLLRRMGGVSCDAMTREFGSLLRGLGVGQGVRFYDARAAITTEMNRAGVPDLELRYLTGHTPGDILNAYVTLDPDGALEPYFRDIRPLLRAIAERARLLLV
jgi:integrase